ncbi:hypothetical protein L5515_014115 [Caenorhabditis briggsae]|uniref:Tyrosine-protein kinase n=1 Tax=Caenorhabditis briggsae TaxID=6238 RepID=A0AAE9EEJ9_CAEBR|nr:hypothetical protein L5515_014115 [Caenorhabditis briggsae]
MNSSGFKKEDGTRTIKTWPDESREYLTKYSENPLDAMKEFYMHARSSMHIDIDCLVFYMDDFGEQFWEVVYWLNSTFREIPTVRIYGNNQHEQKLQYVLDNVKYKDRLKIFVETIEQRPLEFGYGPWITLNYLMSLRMMSGVEGSFEITRKDGLTVSICVFSSGMYYYDVKSEMYYYDKSDKTSDKTENTTDEGIPTNSVMISFRDDEYLQKIEKCKSVERITNEMIENNLLRYPFFHGFVLQELQLMLLKTNGDYIMRLSHQPEKKAKSIGVKKASAEKTGPVDQSTLTRVILVLSVNITQKPDNTRSFYGDLDEVKQKENMDMHVCIEEINGKWVSFFVERRTKFASIDDLITYYRTNPICYQATRVFLKRPIPLQDWELRKDGLEVIKTKKLGEGAYGEVYLGKWAQPFSVDQKEFHKWCDVAVKMLKKDDSRAALFEIMHEARLQLQLRHKNVLAFRGVFLLKKPIMLVSEFCENGSLKDYLQKNKVGVDDKLRFCLGSSCGLEYIHFKGLIHRDLATRNILVSLDKTPKIADFGLAKHASTYKMRRNTKIPVRYLAPETLSSFVYSTKTDVYTFGLVIWEIFANGQEPYIKAQPHQESAVPKNVPLKGKDIQLLIKKELFVRFNPETPAALQQYVTTKLFVTDEKKRPNITEVTTFLADMLKVDLTKMRFSYKVQQ